MYHKQTKMIPCNETIIFIIKGTWVVFLLSLAFNFLLVT
jgi:hypothetical protein